MPTTHTVKQGECLSLLAKRYGFCEYQAIYEHSANAELRKRRPDPHVLLPGDNVVIPERSSRGVPCATGQSHAFVAKQPRRQLVLVLKDAEGKCIANTKYTLQSGGAKLSGATDAQGRIDVSVPVDVEEGLLTLLPSELRLQLRIGHLDPVEHADTSGSVLSGIQARLNNLGYGTVEVSGALDEATRSALRRFQQEVLNREDPDGEPDSETHSALRREHGC